MASTVTLQTIDDIEKSFQCSLAEASDASFDELMRLYHQAVQQGHDTEDNIRFSFKVLADPFFRETLKYYHSVTSLIDAGFMDDGLAPGIVEQSYLPHVSTSDLTKIQKRLLESKTDKNVVLLATGAFAPIHEGHMDMLVSAKEALEKEGYFIAGGLFAPEHDEYLKRKANGAEEWPISRRLIHIQKQLEGYDWMDADVWSPLYVSTDVKYTDVIQRTSLHLSTALAGQPPLSVVYVFGGDHSRHAHTFIGHGQAVCVNRARYNFEFQRTKEEFSQMGNNRVMFVDGSLIDISSTQIRNNMR